MLFKLRLKWWVYEHHVAILFILAVLTLLVGFCFHYKVLGWNINVDWKIPLTIIGSLVSFIFIFQKQAADEAKLFKDLFIEFNKRYDGINNKLNEILNERNKQVFEIEGARDTLFDYFNLCAEEYLFYKKGYIYPEIWASWINGMSIYFSDSRIRDLWLDEQKTASYYGFDFDRERKHLKVK